MAAGDTGEHPSRSEHSTRTDHTTRTERPPHGHEPPARSSTATRADLGRPRTSKRTPDETRGRLISAAIDVFLDVGYQRASIKEIATRAGVTSGTIYRHFDNKAHLLSVAIDTALSTMRTRRNDPGTSPWSPIRDVVADYTNPQLGPLRGIAVLMHDAAVHDDETREQLVDLQSTAHAQLTEQIGAAIVRDDLPDDLDPAHAASLLVVVAMGLSHLEVLQPGLIGDTAFAEYVEAAIVAGISSPRLRDRSPESEPTNKTQAETEADIGT
jgi:AcrR family transcriptional regulator